MQNDLGQPIGGAIDPPMVDRSGLSPSMEGRRCSVTPLDGEAHAPDLSVADGQQKTRLANQASNEDPAAR